jgi:hypothetical protein
VIAKYYTDDYYEDVKEDDMFDGSEYDKDHKCYNPKNEKVPGKFKDETGGKIINKFVALKPKMYAFEVQNVRKNRAKGIKTYKAKTFGFQEYEDCLINKTIQYTNFNCLRSTNHKINVLNINKVGLSAYDDKKFILDDGIRTLPHGFRGDL